MRYKKTANKFIQVFLSLIFMSTLFAQAVSAQSLPQNDLNSIYGDTVWYDTSDSSGGGPGNICLGSGTLPKSVPEPYNSIFTAAANKYNVAPALLAALFYAGEHGSSWPNPPPPYGTGGPWATSVDGAEGPFQFLPSTWSEYGVDGNGDGVADIQDLTDASFGAAKLLGADGAANTTDEQAIKNAIYDYNHSQAYVNAVWGAYVTFSTGSPSPAAGSTCSTTGAGGLTNPFPKGWIPGRLDMGYDGHFTDEIVSPCDGKMVYVNPDSDHGYNGGWEGAFMTVECSQSISALPSSDFYFAEGVSPTVKQGQAVTAGQQIGVPGWTGYSEGPGGIEWGLADPNDPGNTLALRSQQGCPNNGAYKSMVLNFEQWAVQNLGVKPYPPGDPANRPGCA